MPPRGKIDDMQALGDVALSDAVMVREAVQTTLSGPAVEFLSDVLEQPISPGTSTGDIYAALKRAASNNDMKIAPYLKQAYVARGLPVVNASNDALKQLFATTIGAPFRSTSKTDPHVLALRLIEGAGSGDPAHPRFGEVMRDTLTKIEKGAPEIKKSGEKLATLAGAAGGAGATVGEAAATLQTAQQITKGQSLRNLLSHLLTPKGTQKTWKHGQRSVYLALEGMTDPGEIGEFADDYLTLRARMARGKDEAKRIKQLRNLVTEMDETMLEKAVTEDEWKKIVSSEVKNSKKLSSSAKATLSRYDALLSGEDLATRTMQHHGKAATVVSFHETFKSRGIDVAEYADKGAGVVPPKSPPKPAAPMAPTAPAQAADAVADITEETAEEIAEEVVDATGKPKSMFGKLGRWAKTAKRDPKGALQNIQRMLAGTGSAGIARQGILKSLARSPGVGITGALAYSAAESMFGIREGREREARTPDLADMYAQTKLNHLQQRRFLQQFAGDPEAAREYMETMGQQAAQAQQEGTVPGRVGYGL